MSKILKNLFSRKEKPKKTPLKERKKIVIKRKQPVFKDDVIENTEEKIEEVFIENESEKNAVPSTDEAIPVPIPADIPTAEISDTIKEDNSALQIAIAEYKEKNLELLGIIDELKIDLKAKEEELIVSSIEEGGVTEKKELQTTIAKLNHLNKNLEQQIETLETEKKNVILEMQTQRENATESNDSLNSLEQGLKALNKKNTALEQKQKSLESTIVKIQSEKETLSNQIQQLKIDNSSKEKELARLRTQQEQSNKIQQSLEKEKSILLKEKETLATKCNQLNAKNNNIKKEKDDLSIQIKEAMDRNTQISNQIPSLQQKITVLNTAKTEWEQEKSSLLKTKNTLESKCTDLEKEVAENAKKINDLLEKNRILSVANKAKETKVEQEEEIINLFIRILPDEEEFEVEMSSLITGNELILELIEAELLDDRRTYDIIIKNTGLTLPKNHNLGEARVKNNESLIVRRA